MKVSDRSQDLNIRSTNNLKEPPIAMSHLAEEYIPRVLATIKIHIALLFKQFWNYLAC